MAKEKPIIRQIKKRKWIENTLRTDSQAIEKQVLYWSCRDGISISELLPWHLPVETEEVYEIFSQDGQFCGTDLNLYVPESNS
jgi:hypothetical protein